ncbi:MAG TPA: nucleotidyltransferase family protein [Actinomycetota bacterium]|nr:nucleotidyltransferase family protein [Actinomycetota bacterium]
MSLRMGKRPAVTVATTDVLRGIAAFGLDPRDEAPGRISLSEEEWEGLAEEIELRRLSGLALAAVSAEVVRLPEESRGDLTQRQRSAMLWALKLERILVKLGEEFSRAGAAVAVLKGPAVAHTVYPDASWRPFGDIDLLVTGRHWQTACAIVEAAGFRRRAPEPRPGFNERFGQGTTYVDASGVEVDLHRRLVFGAFGRWIDPDELLDRSVPFQLGGAELRRLDDTALMVHACVNASLGGRSPAPLALRDVAQIARSGRVDWGALDEAVARWRCRAVIRHATEAVSRGLSVGIPVELARVASAPVSRQELRALAAYTTERRGRGGKARSTLRSLPGIRAKSSFVWSLVFPDGEFVAAREGSRGRTAYLRRWTTPLRWLGSH